MKSGSSNYQKYKSANPIKQYFLGKFINLITDIVARENCKSIGDLGCGEGMVVNKIRSKCPDILIEGYDFSQSSLERARQINPAVNFYKLDLTDTSALKQLPGYDLLLMLEVLEHINQFELALSNVSHMNFKKLIISVPDEPLFSLSNMAFGKNMKRWGKDPEHVNFWNLRSFKSLMEKYFTVKKIYQPYPWLVAECRKKKS